MSRLAGQAARLVNGVLGAFKLRIERVRSTPAGFENYIPFQSTFQSARAAGLPIGDWIERTYNVPGSVDQTITQLEALGVFDLSIDRVCEIGPGSGRYLERVMQRCRPTTYEIYETAEDWRNWLSDNYPVISHKTDGSTLVGTPSGVVDLTQAHKVFPGLPVLTICRYVQEMARVTRESGFIAFDVLTEECFAGTHLQEWLNSTADYPCGIIPRSFAIDLFARHGCGFVGSFTIPMKPGITEVLVFRKCQATPATATPARC